MRLAFVFCLLALLVGCASAAPPIEIEEPVAVVPPPYLPVAWDLNAEPWQGTYGNYPFIARLCSSHHFWSEGIFVEQIYCHAEFLVEDETLIACPILMVRLDLEEVAMGTTPHPLADPLCAAILPMFETTEPPPQPEPIERKREPRRDSRSSYAAR